MQTACCHSNPLSMWGSDGGQGGRVQRLTVSHARGCELPEPQITEAEYPISLFLMPLSHMALPLPISNSVAITIGFTLKYNPEPTHFSPHSLLPPWLLA